MFLLDLANSNLQNGCHAHGRHPTPRKLAVRHLGARMPLGYWTLVTPGREVTVFEWSPGSTGTKQPVSGRNTKRRRYSTSESKAQKASIIESLTSFCGKRSCSSRRFCNRTSDQALISEDVRFTGVVPLAGIPGTQRLRKRPNVPMSIITLLVRGKTLRNLDKISSPWVSRSPQ